MTRDGRITKLARAARVFYHWGVRKSTTLPYQPTEISIEPTNRCNFACSFCPQSKPDHFDSVPATTLEPEGVRRLMEKIRAAGVRTDIMHWTLDGEPFMNKRFHELLEVAEGYGFRTHHFATNGMLMTADRLHRFPRGSRIVMTPDFCSDEAFFEKVRGSRGSWVRVRDNIAAALEDPGLDHVSFKVTDISSFGFDDPADLDRRFAALKALFPRSRRISFFRRAFHNASGTMESRLGEGGRSRYQVCPYPWYTMYIGNNGDVVACCRDLEHQTVLGNLFRQELMEIWNGEPYQALRRDLLEGHPERQAACDGCDMPWDAEKFSVRNFAKTAMHRLLIFD